MAPTRQGVGTVMEPRSARRTGHVLAAVLIAMAAAACGSSSKTSSQGADASTQGAGATRMPGAGKPAVVLGTKNFTEEFILGQLYAQALRAKGFSVTLRNDIGPSEVMARKIATGQIDGYPEYTGTILSVVAHDRRRPTSARAAYRLAAKVVRHDGAALLAMASASDTDVVITKPTYATEHRLKSLGDLARLRSTGTLAGPPEFRTRFSGLIGLRHEYGVTSLHFLPRAIGAQYQALADGSAQLAVAFTTDGNLTRKGFTLLSDPKNIFGFQNVTFVIRRSVLSREGPAFAAAINAVSARLSTQALRLMNAAVSLDQQTPAAVARQFLGANGLL